MTTEEELIEELTTALQSEFAFLMGVGLVADRPEWSKAATGIIKKIAEARGLPANEHLELIAVDEADLSDHYREGYNQGHKDGSQHHGPCRGLPS